MSVGLSRQLRSYRTMLKDKVIGRACLNGTSGARYEAMSAGFGLIRSFMRRFLVVTTLRLPLVYPFFQRSPAETPSSFRMAVFQAPNQAEMGYPFRITAGLNRGTWRTMRTRPL